MQFGSTAGTMYTIPTFLLLLTLASGHGDHDQTPIQGPHKGLWYNQLPGDGGTQADSVFSGIATFGRVQYHPCLVNEDVDYDIAFIGIVLIGWPSASPPRPTDISSRSTIRHRHFL